jgi:hypothetical protein
MSTMLETRVSTVEKWLEKTAYAQFEYQMKLNAFHDEMQVFKNEQRRETREMNRKWGELANKMGTMIEDIVLPNLPGILREHFGVEETVMTAPRIRRRHPHDRSRSREFDAIVVSDDTVFVNETKSTVRPTDIERFAESYREVLEYFPEYADYTVVPIMSSLYIPPETVAELTKRRIFAMAMGEDNMELLNAGELGRPVV